MPRPTAHVLLAVPALLALTLATVPATAAGDDRLDAPKIEYREGSAGPTGGGHLTLVFEAENPNKASLPYIGYLADSFEPPVPDGEIAPIYRVEFRRDGEWVKHDLGFCKDGQGEVSLKPEGKATFTVVLPSEGWDAVRVGLTWYASPDRVGPVSTAWSEPITRESLAKRTDP